LEKNLQANAERTRSGLDFLFVDTPSISALATQIISRRLNQAGGREDKTSGGIHQALQAVHGGFLFFMFISNLLYIKVARK
jgi:hypothetical protein